MADERTHVDHAPVPPLDAGRPKPKRPAFALIVGAVVVFRGLREFGPRLIADRFGYGAAAAAFALFLLLPLVWILAQRRRSKARGGLELTPEDVARQIRDSGLPGPAFEEDGTMLGASTLVVSQRTKLVELATAYDVYDRSGQPLGSIVQFGQSRLRRAVRLFTAFDQFLTHHFEVYDASGGVVMRLTRPRKLFRTTLHVFDPSNTYIGTLRQQNVFGKVRFALIDPSGHTIGNLRAQNWRAWDFRIEAANGSALALLTKSWEGWARTAFTRADRYVVHVNQVLPEPLRSLTLVAALTVDLALKQDSRAYG